MILIQLHLFSRQRVLLVQTFGVDPFDGRYVGKHQHLELAMSISKDARFRTPRYYQILLNLTLKCLQRHIKMRNSANLYIVHDILLH